MSRTAKKIGPQNGSMNPVPANVFSNQRRIVSPSFPAPHGMEFNKRMQMNGLEFLNKLPQESVPIAFFDPQYRGVLDKLSYGNEDKKRGQKRCALPQMSEKFIAEFVQGIEATLIPSGHLFLWVDKFHLCTGIHDWLDGTILEIVDMLTWHKNRIAMGYRTRKTSEYLIVLQKTPRRAKGVWKIHTIPAVWTEEIR